jgi:serine protease Do
VERRIVVGGVLLTTVVMTVAGMGMRANAQSRGFADPRVAVQAPEPFIFDGEGSSIGISVRDATSEELQKAKVNQSGGAFVVSVVEGGPGAKAGLRSGDLVTEFDGERVRSARQLTRLVRETVAGRAVKSSIVRDGSRQTLDITPENRNTREFSQIGPGLDRHFRDLSRNFSFNFNPDDFRGGSFSVFGRGRLGATLVPLGEQLASYFGVKQGALVSSVDPDSSAAKAGLKAGDVITSINGKSVDQAVDVTDEVRRAQPGSSLDITVMRDKKEVKLKATVPESSRPRPTETRRSREV